MKSTQLWFTQPGQVELRDTELPPPGVGELQVRSTFSAISAGTELLVFRGQLPGSMALDESIEGYADSGISYPLLYGYACVGKVEAIGDGVDPVWLGKRLFSFQPHASAFNTGTDNAIEVPDDIAPEAAVFLANMETAVNLLHDALPRLGDRVAVVGQGIVGLLVTALAGQFPLKALYAVDGLQERRELALKLGASQAVDPASNTDMAGLLSELRGETPAQGADLVLELSGSPAAVNTAIDLCAYSGRLVIGSWYGTKPGQINLGERFHRSRIELISSQVSTIAPALCGRWDKQRRFGTAWDMIRRIQPESLISHVRPLTAAAEVYELLDGSAEDAVQVVFDYSQTGSP